MQKYSDFLSNLICLCWYTHTQISHTEYTERHGKEFLTQRREGSKGTLREGKARHEVFSWEKGLIVEQDSDPAETRARGYLLAGGDFFNAKAAKGTKERKELFGILSHRDTENNNISTTTEITEISCHSIVHVIPVYSSFLLEFIILNS